MLIFTYFVAHICGHIVALFLYAVALSRYFVAYNRGHSVALFLYTVAFRVILWLTTVVHSKSALGA